MYNTRSVKTESDHWRLTVNICTRSQRQAPCVSTKNPKPPSGSPTRWNMWPKRPATSCATVGLTPPTDTPGPPSLPGPPAGSSCYTSATTSPRRGSRTSSTSCRTRTRRRRRRRRICWRCQRRRPPGVAGWASYLTAGDRPWCPPSWLRDASPRWRRRRSLRRWRYSSDRRPWWSSEY